MDRTYRASNAVYVYAALLLVTALVLAFEAWSRLQAGAAGIGAALAAFAAVWLMLALWFFVRYGRMRVIVRPDSLVVDGGGLTRRLAWADVERVREVRGPAYQLSLQRLLPGPYLPHSLVRGETVLELVARPSMRLVLRRALVQGYGALQQDVLRAVPRTARVDLHARWWHA